MIKYIKHFLFILLFIIFCFVLACTYSDKYNTDRKEMIAVATNFLEAVKQNDTSKVRSKLFYGLIKSDNFKFANEINAASEMIIKYGLPQSEKISLDSSIHNVPTTIAVVFPLYHAPSPEEDLQNASLRVIVQKISGKYEVILFENEFLYKMSSIN